MTVTIISAKFLQSSPRVDQCPQSDRQEYAVICRSNVGKSSLNNTGCDDKKLEIKISIENVNKRYEKSMLILSQVLGFY